MAWDALYEAQPTDSTYVADTDDAIRSTKTEIRTRVAKEHGFNLSESAPQTGHGKHLRGSARAFVSDTSVADPTTVTADDANYSTGRLQVYPTLKRLGYYSGSAWVDLIRNSSGQLFSEVATGTAPLVVASTTEVANLRSATASNALLLDGLASSAYMLAASNSSGVITNYPVGTTVLVLTANNKIINNSYSVYTTPGQVVFSFDVTGTVLSGTWRCRGATGSGTGQTVLMQRTA